MSKRPVVFDLDGTIIDSSRDIVVSANHARHRAGLPPLDDEIVVGFVGDGARYLVASIFELPQDDPRVDVHLSVFLEYYEAHAVDHTVLMPDAEPVMARLSRGRALGLCTNKPRRTTLAVLEGLGIRERFQVIVAGGDTARNKPSGDPLLLCAAQLDVAPAQLIMVGDGPQDILAARAVGALGVGLRGGILPVERLLAASPDVLLSDLSELPALVEELDRRAS